MLALILQDTLSCLQEVYIATNGDQWITNLNWTTTTDYCDFYGVTCEDNKIQIKRFELVMNNLNGVLPDCLQDVDIYEYYLPGNNILGPLPNVSDYTQRLDLRINNISSLPKNWCHTTRNGIYISQNSNLNGKTVDSCVFNTFSVDFEALNITSSGQVEFNGVGFIVSGNHLENLEVNFTNIEKCQVLRALNSGVKSINIINLSIAEKMTELKIGNTKIQITGKYPVWALSIDVSNAIDERVFNFKNLHKNITMYAAKNSKKCGMVPSVQEYEAYIKTNKNILLDLSENNFFCRNDAEHIFDCQFAVIKSGKRKNNSTVELSFELENEVSIEIIFSDIKVAANINGEVQVFEINTAVQNNNSYTLEISISDTVSFTKLHENFAILYDNIQISTGDLTLPQQISDALNIKSDKKFTEISHSFWQFKKQPKAFTFGITAMSHCPDYSTFIRYSVIPFQKQYPEIFKHFSYQYIAMSSPYYNEYLNATSMHGQVEVFDDSVLLCANQVLDDQIYLTFTECFVTNSYHIQDCMDLVLSGSEKNEILMCTSDESYKLINEQFDLNDKILNSRNCPTMYIGLNDFSQFDVSQNSLPKPFEIRDFICDFISKNVKDKVPECE
ncbi:hypothetical protein SS50377_25335 [Spironucleus salmonicida]|uniref:Leucine rich repeat-containing protein n=1 Tax=Spironucleus salmonicida TaxID=348837 RepID=V6LBJ6_9EUKA|nr:hypothetical protein SS50377_25335 [Spironucleus salmonicida]|eukprot:EST41787.1 hypothetical protein SS50377_18620 [Spironucleus salmonicida]